MRIGEWIRAKSEDVMDAGEAIASKVVNDTCNALGGYVHAYASRVLLKRGKVRL
jgi:hypothetical protein